MSAFVAVLSFVLLQQCVEQATSTIDGCTYRYDLRKAHYNWHKRHQTCEDLRKIHPQCREEIEVAYSNSPPYVQNSENSTEAYGLVADMLTLAIQTCCFNCTKIKYIGPFETLQTLKQNTTIIMPLQSASSSKYYIEMVFVPFVDLHSVVFLSKEDSNLGERLSRQLFKSILNTWPLFLIAFMMAVVAGCVVWVLDMFFNRSDFPTSFPKGPFEGFWWAFVSMTTVGYGDHAPKSVVAKLFAIFWIMLGITIFSMYTATLTTALSSNIADLKETSVSGKKVGLMVNSAIAKSAASLENAKHQVYFHISDMFKALANDDIEAIVLEDNLLKYCTTNYKDEIPNLTIHHSIRIEGTSYGIGVQHDVELGMFLRTFFETNNDNKVAMLNDIIAKYWPTYHSLEENKIDSTNYFNADSPIFIGTMVTLIVLFILAIVLGFVFKWVVKRHSDVIPNYVRARIDTASGKYPEGSELLPINEKTVAIENFINDLDKMKENLTKMLNQMKTGTET